MTQPKTKPGTEIITESSIQTQGRWAIDALHVRRAVKFMRSRPNFTAQDLVEWDFTHGKKLFTWDDEKAAEEHRLYEARLFANRFRAMFDGMRVRAFIAVPVEVEEGKKERAYYSADTISRNQNLRVIVVEDLKKRIMKLMSELKLWNLSATEREALIEELLALIS